MILEQRPDRGLVIHESFRFLRAGSVVCAALAAVVGGFLWIQSPDILRETKGIGWGAVAVGLFCAVGLAVDDRRFVFDAPRRTVTWHRRNAFRSCGGEIHFAQIRDVVITTEHASDDGGSRGAVRHGVALVTTSGTVPLTSTFGRDPREFQRVADAALDVLASQGNVARPGVEQLVAAGRIIDAVAWLRRERGLDLAAARAVIEELKRARRHEGG